MSDADFPVNQIVIDDWDDAEALCWIVSKHARKVRDAVDMIEHAEAIFDISGKAHEELKGDRDDVQVVYDSEHELAILYEATEYAVEDGPGAEIDPTDVAVARRIYEKLGGEPPTQSSEEFGEDVARAVEASNNE